jgi:hypothetical protein
MIPLFLVVVCGASLKVAAPMISELVIVKAQDRLVEHLEQQSKQAEVHLALLDGQKTNTVLAIKHQRQVSDKLTDELKNQTSLPWMIWIVMGFSTFLRFSVQLANLVFAHSLGQIWNNGKKTVIVPEKLTTTQTANSNLQIRYNKVCRYLKKNGGQVTRGQILSSRVLRGGVKDYDKILGNLERLGKIRVDQEKAAMKDWIYFITE